MKKSIKKIIIFIAGVLLLSLIMIIIFPQILTATYTKIKYNKNDVYSFLYTKPINKNIVAVNDAYTTYEIENIKFKTPWKDKPAIKEINNNMQMFEFSKNHSVVISKKYEQLEYHKYFDDTKINKILNNYNANNNYQALKYFFNLSPGDYSNSRLYLEKWMYPYLLEKKKYLLHRQIKNYIHLKPIIFMAFNILETVKQLK